LTAPTLIHTIPSVENTGGVCMKGKVRTWEKCTVCKGNFVLALIGEHMDLMCPNCKTRPRSYYVDARALGAGKIWTDNKTGETFRYYEAAYQQLETMRKKVKDHTFDPNDYIAKKAEEIKVKTLSTRWLERIKIDKSYSYCRHSKTEMELHISPVFGETDVRDIRNHHIADFYYHLLGKGLSPKSVKNILATFKTFLNSLDDLVPRLPKFPVVKVPEKAGGWINTQSQCKIVSAIPERHRLIFETLIELWCRPAEVCALKKRDLIDGEVCIERAFDEKGGIKERKSGKVLYRGISLQLYNALIQTNKDKLPEAWLFVDEFGKPYSQARLYDLWMAAGKKVGIKISLYAGTRRSRASQKRLEMEKEIAGKIAAELGNTKAVAMKHYAKSRKEIL
jgi:integrase